LAQDDYYYEIQLTNKQLIFYFMAGAAGLILSFLAGVMVGRGVDQNAAAGARTTRVQEERVLPEESARPEPSPTQDLSYARRLEGDRREEGLEKPASPAPQRTPEAVASASPEPPPVTLAPSPRPTRTPKPSPSPKASPSPKPSPSPSPSPRGALASRNPVSSGSFTIQVGAFKDRAAADSVAKRLKSKGFAAYVNAPDGAAGGLFNVRVGSFTARADAERVQTRLRDQEKFKPFIVKN
jgi:DedD protein